MVKKYTVPRTETGAIDSKKFCKPPDCYEGQETVFAKSIARGKQCRSPLPFEKTLREPLTAGNRKGLKTSVLTLDLDSLLIECREGPKGLDRVIRLEPGEMEDALRLLKTKMGDDEASPFKKEPVLGVRNVSEESIDTPRPRTAPPQPISKSELPDSFSGSGLGFYL